MFSMEEKIEIATKIEELLLSYNHPEMPDEKPRFKLHVDGKASWSWADIEPNWKFEGKVPGINPWNEWVGALKDDDQNKIADIRARALMVVVLCDVLYDDQRDSGFTNPEKSLLDSLQELSKIIKGLDNG